MNCRLREPLSSLFPSLFYLSPVKPRLPPFTCQCIYNSELSAPGCVGGESSSSLCQHRGTGSERTGQDRMVLDCPEQVCGFVCMCMCVCVFVMDDREQHVNPSVCDRLFAPQDLLSRGAYVEGTELELCPSLHLNALIRSVCL